MYSCDNCSLKVDSTAGYGGTGFYCISCLVAALEARDQTIVEQNQIIEGYVNMPSLDTANLDAAIAKMDDVISRGKKKVKGAV